MIHKLEAGKTYKLINKNGYFENDSLNRKLFTEYFKNDCITIDNVSTEGFGCISRSTHSVITPNEYKHFELVEDTIDLYNINKPFGELDSETKKALLCAWVDGAKIETFNNIVWKFIINPSWFFDCTYRVKPLKSDKDIAIENAQRKLEEAQAELDKAKSL